MLDILPLPLFVNSIEICTVENAANSYIVAILKLVK